MTQLYTYYPPKEGSLVPSVSPHHSVLSLVIKINRAKQTNMQTLTKPVTHNKATSCNSVPSLTTETFPYIRHVCIPPPPSTWSNPQGSECNKNQ